MRKAESNPESKMGGERLLASKSELALAVDRIELTGSFIAHRSGKVCRRHARI